MDLFGSMSGQTFFPGQRIPRLKGYSALEKVSLPRDCEAIFLDEDEDVCYIKKTDSSGSERSWMFDMSEKDIPRFDPKKYVTVNDFNSFKEDVLNAFNDLKQTFTNGSVDS